MPMVQSVLKGILKTKLTKLVSVPSVDAQGNVSFKLASAAPSDEFLDAVTQIVPYIQIAAQISGNLNYAGSGGLGVGVGGAIPGPATVSLTGVPISGVGIMPPGSIQ
jgi:hypothetical protein